MRFIPGDYNNFSITAQRFNLTLGVQHDFNLNWKFNEARSKYRGSGAGEEQKARM